MTKLAIRAAFAACLLTASVHAQTVTMQRPVPYAEDNDISDNIKSECRIGEQLADFIKEYGGDVQFDTGTVDVNARGRVLHLEITDAVSMGNAWLGHQKSTKVKGVLYQDGQRIAAFKARRNSMGGAFAGYKGSCSVLGRTVKALGEDIAGWLKVPVDGATLGD
jgi:hypothetical protein